MTQTSSFSALGISPEILEAIEVLGFDTPSSIQEQAIPAAISGADIVGLSHTGSGKTLAFAIPALECIEPEERCVQVLALCPTRELAVQICREVDKLALFMDGVSAVPMAARVSQVVGQKENPANFLLMHAMGPNVAGVIGSAIAAGVLMSLFG